MQQLILIIAALCLISPFAANADIITYTGDGFGTGSYIVAVVETSGGAAGVYSSDNAGLLGFDMQAFDASGALLFSLDESQNIDTTFNNYIELDSAGVVTAWFLFARDTFKNSILTAANVNTVISGGFLCVTCDEYVQDSGGNNQIGFVSSNNPGAWTGGDSVTVPEPGTLALLGLGLAGMGMRRRKKKV